MRFVMLSAVSELVEKPVFAKMEGHWPWRIAYLSIDEEALDLLETIEKYGYFKDVFLSSLSREDTKSTEYRKC